MRTVVIDEPGVMSLREAEIPVPEANEVLVRVHAAGVCAGDLAIYKGKNPYVIYPAVGGHEISGTIEAVGSSVSDFRYGDRVVVEPFISCGHCYPCRIGKGNCCINLSIIGVHRPGGYAEFVVAPAHLTHRVPDGLDLVWASFAEPLAIGVQAIRRAELGGELCVVLGCGPIGLAIIEVALQKGATVLATDTDLDRLRMAESVGASTSVAGDGFDNEILEATNGEGAPVVIEATGVPSVMAHSLDLVAPGGRVIIVGLVPGGVKVPFEGLDLTRKEATILGSRASVRCFPEALELLASGKIRYPKVAQTFSMWEAPGLFARIVADPGYVHKGVLIAES